ARGTGTQTNCPPPLQRARAAVRGDDRAREVIDGRTWQNRDAGPVHCIYWFGGFISKGPCFSTLCLWLQVAIGNVIEGRDFPPCGRQQKSDVGVDFTLAPMDLWKQTHLGIRNGRDVEERRLPLVSLTPGNSCKTYIGVSAGIQK